MRLLASLLLSLLPAFAQAQTVFDSELWVSSKTGVGTSSPGARFEARGSSATTAWFQVSGVDLSPAFRIGSDATLGLSTASAARATVSGSADTGDLALELRGGDLYPDASNYQATFGYAGGTLYRHAIRSKHANSVSSNSLTFLLWNSGSASAPGSSEVLTLLTHSTGTTVHILPPAGAALSTYTVQLVVSNGTDIGAGTMRRKSEGSVSSALIKEGIVPLSPEAEQAAFEEVKALKHVRFRYKGMKGKKRFRGLLYEEAPASVQAPGGTISFDRRLLNAELAARELLRALEREEADARALSRVTP